MTPDRRPSPGEYLTPAEVAERLQVGTDRVRAWIRRGELPAVLVSTDRRSKRPAYRILSEQLEAFLEDRRIRRPLTRRRRRPRDYERFV